MITTCSAGVEAFTARTVQEADGKIMLRWDTVPGLLDRLETSQDLVTWTPTTVSCYGFGGEIGVHVFTVQLPGPSPAPLPSSLPRTRCRFFWITTFADPAHPGGIATIGTRDAAENVWTVKVDANFAGTVANVLGSFTLSGTDLYIVESDGSHPMVLTGNISDWRSPEIFYPTQALSSVPAETRGWIEKIIAKAGMIRQQRNDRAAAIANMPLVESPAGPKAYFRVKRSQVDSDGDSLWDDEEWTAGTNAWFIDSNFDGVTDAQAAGKGSTVDSDKDGLVDDEDAVPWDKKLHFKRAPESSYVFIPLGQGYPAFLNDLNQVVLTTNSPIATSGAPDYAPFTHRIWNAAEGISRPVTLPSGYRWKTGTTSDDVKNRWEIKDLDNEGRLYITNAIPASNPDADYGPGAKASLYSPVRSFIIPADAPFNPIKKLLPLPGLPPLSAGNLGLDHGEYYEDGPNDGHYTGGIRPSLFKHGLLSDGRVFLETFTSKTLPPTVHPLLPLQRSRRTVERKRRLLI